MPLDDGRPSCSNCAQPAAHIKNAWPPIAATIARMRGVAAAAMRDLRATARAGQALNDRAAAREAARTSRPVIAQSPGHLAPVARPAHDVRSSITRPARDGVVHAVARARRGGRCRTWRRPGDLLLEFRFPIDSKSEIQC
ncbi:hypothetical protein F511_47131 [Dorcoceras hygrometricum]|uniref:Uncharacterized protein n=1 Tax=Dorcoceras hygrometricum TaxID=472368 RepID=A0A2Z6ZRV2_9LAMI|nr:hypothetical protein F511_47131 [Dorcoceras hygrometricum]